MFKDPLGKEYPTYKDYIYSSDLDSDLICLALWRGEREPQNEEEKKMKLELDEMRRQGKEPDIFWFD